MTLKRECIKKHFFIVDFYTHTLQTPIGYVIIPKLHFSSCEGINSRCHRFYLHFAVLAQSVAAITAVVAVQVVAVPTGRWQSTVIAVTQIQPSLVHSTEHMRSDSVFSSFSSITNLLGRTEMRTRERKELPSI